MVDCYETRFQRTARWKIFILRMEAEDEDGVRAKEMLGLRMAMRSWEGEVVRNRGVCAQDCRRTLGYL